MNFNQHYPNLPESVRKASLCIYDLQGKQIRCHPLNGTGHGGIIINGNELAAGMYLYALIADGKEIDTKRMILTE